MTDAAYNKALVRRYHEAFNKGSLTDLDDIFADTFVNHTARFGPSPDLAGAAAGRQTLLTAWEQFPGGQMIIDDIVAEGDRVAVRWRLESNSIGGAPALSVPTRVHFTGMSFYRIEGGRIAERWVSLGMSAS